MLNGRETTLYHLVNFELGGEVKCESNPVCRKTSVCVISFVQDCSMVDISMVDMLMTDVTITIPQCNLIYFEHMRLISSSGFKDAIRKEGKDIR